MEYMESLRELYRIGAGPSSSHTIGPERAAAIIKGRYSNADRFEVILYGSLAKTGKGHMTDRAVFSALSPIPCVVTFDTKATDLPHPNTMLFLAFEKDVCIGRQRVMSVGGGKIVFEGEVPQKASQVYPMHTFMDIKEYCLQHNMRLYDYILSVEGAGIYDFLLSAWRQMVLSINNGLAAEGVLQGGLEVVRKAKYLYDRRVDSESDSARESRIVCAYAYAVGEENASGGRVVTAPTCGAAGVVPSVLRYMQEKHSFDDEKIVHALAAAGIIGNLIKTNASISGAECGCQAEIGSACSMAAAGLADLFGMELDQIEYAAEVAMEHHLGLTCDPIGGLVQIPCIERNAVAALRAIDAVTLATFLTSTRKISFDLVVETMYETGKDLFSKYRETGEGGLAQTYRK